MELSLNNHISRYKLIVIEINKILSLDFFITKYIFFVTNFHHKKWGMFSDNDNLLFMLYKYFVKLMSISKVTMTHLPNTYSGPIKKTF